MDAFFLFEFQKRILNSHGYLILKIFFKHFYLFHPHYPGLLTTPVTFTKMNINYLNRFSVTRLYNII